MGMHNVYSCDHTCGKIGALYCVHHMVHSRGYRRPLLSSLPLQPSWLFHPTCMCRVAELSLACRVQVCCRTSRLPRVQRQYSTSSEQKGGLCLFYIERTAVDQLISINLYCMLYCPLLYIMRNDNFNLYELNLNYTCAYI